MNELSLNLFKINSKMISNHKYNQVFSNLPLLLVKYFTYFFLYP